MMSKCIRTTQSGEKLSLANFKEKSGHKEVKFFTTNQPLGKVCYAYQRKLNLYRKNKSRCLKNLQYESLIELNQKYEDGINRVFESYLLLRNFVLTYIWLYEHPSAKNNGIPSQFIKELKVILGDGLFIRYNNILTNNIEEIDEEPAHIND